MGTRSTIQFKIGRKKITIYVQYDGMWEYMVPFIQKFLKWNGCRSDDVGQTAANWIFYHKYTGLRTQIESMKDMKESVIPRTMDEFFDKALDNLGATHAGCHITNNNHQGEQYFYIVDLKKKIISEEDNKWGFDEEFKMPQQIAQ